MKGPALDLENIYFPIFERFAILLALVFVFSIAYFDPFQWLPIEAKELDWVLLAAIVVLIFFAVSTLFSRVVGAVFFDNGAFVIEWQRIFSAKQNVQTLSIEDLYFIKSNSTDQQLTLLSKFGDIKIYSSNGVLELSQYLTSQYFLNKAYYESLDRSHLYDIYHALPAGKQAALVRSVMNQNAEENKPRFIKEVLESVTISEQKLGAQCNGYKPFDVCPRCGGDKLLEGGIQSAHHHTTFKAHDYRIPFLHQVAAVHYPSIKPIALTCLGPVNTNKIAPVTPKIR